MSAFNDDKYLNILTALGLPHDVSHKEVITGIGSLVIENALMKNTLEMILPVLTEASAREVKQVAAVVHDLLAHTQNKGTDKFVNSLRVNSTVH